MPETTVVHVREAYDVYIGRAVSRRGLKTSDWANPFRVDEVGRVLAIDLFREWLLHSPEYSARWMREHIGDLRGKRLGCWCAPNPCHGDVLAELANATH